MFQHLPVCVSKSGGDSVGGTGLCAMRHEDTRGRRRVCRGGGSQIGGLQSRPLQGGGGDREGGADGVRGQR